MWSMIIRVRADVGGEYSRRDGQWSTAGHMRGQWEEEREWLTGLEATEGRWIRARALCRVRGKMRRVDLGWMGIVYLEF